MQDLPPSQGFKPIQYKRNLPKRGPSGFTIFAGLTLICSAGFYQVIQGRKQRLEWEREKRWGRLYLVPLLQAELDRDIARREAAQAKEEAAISEELDWDSLYHQEKKRYIPRLVRLSP